MLNVLMWAGAAFGAAVAPSAPLNSSPALPEGAFALAAKNVLVDGKTVVEGGVVVVERGRVREVLDAKNRAKADGLPLVEHDGWVSAGMIAARTHLGTRGEVDEPKRPMTPQARMLDVIDFGHTQFEDALRAGVTTVIVTPSNASLVGGQSAAVKTHGRVVLDPDAHLVMALGSSALRFNREPTSYPGAMALLAREFDKPQGAIAQAASGELPVMIDVGDRHEVSRALEFAQRHKLKGVLSRAPRAGEMAADVKKSGLGVVIGPFPLGASDNVLDSVVRLARESVPLAFGLDSGSSAHELRMSAVMCVRRGLAADHAWNALTSHAAAILGLEKRVGTLRAGCDADLVLWSAHPLELTSRVQGVYIAGEYVWGGHE